MEKMRKWFFLFMIQRIYVRRAIRVGFFAGAFPKIPVIPGPVLEGFVRAIRHGTREGSDRIWEGYGGFVE